MNQKPSMRSCRKDIAIAGLPSIQKEAPSILTPGMGSTTTNRIPYRESTFATWRASLEYAANCRSFVFTALIAFSENGAANSLHANCRARKHHAFSALLSVGIIAVLRGAKVSVTLSNESLLKNFLSDVSSSFALFALAIQPRFIMSLIGAIR